MWRYFGDWRGVLLSLWAGSMQNMHPQLGAGVEEHSRFFDERWQRLTARSTRSAAASTTATARRQTAAQVRDYHRTINGVDKHGRPYSALNPDTFFWAHATFVHDPGADLRALRHAADPGAEGAALRRGRAVVAALRHEHAPGPARLGRVRRVLRRACAATVLEDNEATRDVLDIARIAKPPALRLAARPALGAAAVPVGTAASCWLTIGLYPPAGARRGSASRGPAATSSRSALVGPRGRHRLAARARSSGACTRAPVRPGGGPAGSRAADAPLVETPARNLPPEHERDQPSHYCPAR